MKLWMFITLPFSSVHVKPKGPRRHITCMPTGGYDIILESNFDRPKLAVIDQLI